MSEKPPTDSPAQAPPKKQRTAAWVPLLWLFSLCCTVELLSPKSPPPPAWVREQPRFWALAEALSMYTIAHDGEPPTELEALVTAGFLDASILAGDGQKRSHIAYLPLTKAELDRLRRKRLDLAVAQWFELECVHRYTRWVSDARGHMRRATTTQVIEALLHTQAELVEAGLMTEARSSQLDTWIITLESQ